MIIFTHGHVTESNKVLILASLNFSSFKCDRTSLCFVFFMWVPGVCVLWIVGCYSEVELEEPRGFFSTPGYPLDYEESWNVLGCSECPQAVWQNWRLSTCRCLGLLRVQIQSWLFMKKATMREGCQVILVDISALCWEPFLDRQLTIMRERDLGNTTTKVLIRVTGRPFFF